MTVIAYDKDLLVADGRATTDNGTVLVSDNFKKLHTLEIPELGKCIVALCGALDLQGPFLKHLKEYGLSEPLDMPDDGDMYMRGLAITRKGVCYNFTSSGGWFQEQDVVALGSGQIVAQHYLTKGCDALTAVLETCKTELTCGGVITVYDIKARTFTEHNASRSP